MSQSRNMWSSSEQDTKQEDKQVGNDQVGQMGHDHCLSFIHGYPCCLRGLNFYCPGAVVVVVHEVGETLPKTLSRTIIVHISHPERGTLQCGGSFLE